MRASLLLISFLLLTNQIFGQSRPYEKGHGVRLTYVYNGINNIDIGFGKGRMRSMEEMIGADGFYGGFINLGYGFTANKSLMTSKVSFEFATLLLGTRINLINYTDFNSNQFFFLPEAGLSYSGIFSLMYGYNMFLTENIFDLNRHSFSIAFIPYWKDTTRKSARK